jgi:hypothetical protein
MWFIEELLLTRHDNKLFDSTKDGWFLDYLRDRQRSKKNSASCSLLFVLGEQTSDGMNNTKAEMTTTYSKRNTFLSPVTMFTLDSASPFTVHTPSTRINFTKFMRFFESCSSLLATLWTDAVLLRNSASNLLHSSLTFYSSTTHIFYWSFPFFLPLLVFSFSHRNE